MFYICVLKFDVTENLEKFWVFLEGTKQGLSIQLEASAICQPHFGL